MIRNVFIMLVGFLAFTPHIQTAGDELIVFGVPGPDNWGNGYMFQEDFDDSDTLLKEKKTDFNKSTSINLVSVSAPFLVPDFGQGISIRHLKKAVDLYNKENLYSDNKRVIHATSQGTATALNYLSSTDQNFDGLILEAVLANGNSSITHSVTGQRGVLPFLKYIPFHYYWLPYCAKALFPCYWPSGKQAINAIADIDQEMPIIIVHSEEDSMHPYSDACALYYGLKQNNNNVYLISTKGDRHKKILSNLEEESEAVRAIFKHHNLIKKSDSDSEINLCQYQPDSYEFQQAYSDLIFKERCHKVLGYGIVTAIGTGIIVSIGAFRESITSCFSSWF